MKHNGLMTLVWVILASIFCGTFYGIAQNDDSVRSYWQKIHYPDPPYYPQGMEPDVYISDVSYSDSPTKSMEMEDIDSIILYPGRFKIWANDTLAIFNLLGNRDFVTAAYPISDKEFVIECSIKDALLGRKLRDSIKNSPHVNYIENFGYSTKARCLLVPDCFISVRLYNEQDSIRLKEIADSMGLSVILRSKFHPIIHWKFRLNNTKENCIQVAKKIYATGFFQYVGDGFVGTVIPDFTYDSLVNEQWGLYNLSNISDPSKNKFTDIGVSKAWNYSTGNGIKICIVDDGFDTTNVDLSGNIKLCFDSGTEENKINIKSTHGTACAGVASAIRNNHYGISGIAPDAKLMLASYYNTKNNSKNLIERIADAIDWAWKNGADIISCSWHIREAKAQDLTLITDAISRAQTDGRNGKGCIVVKSAGNTGDSITFPGNYPGVITVGAVDKNIRVSSFSCFGSNLWVVAPGENIIVPDSVGGFKKMDGTSFATPAVAGLAALILEAYPDATTEEVRNIIAFSSRLPEGVKASSSKKLGNTKCPWNEKYGFGLPNAYKAVDTAIYIARQRKLIYPKPENP